MIEQMPLSGATPVVLLGQEVLPVTLTTLTGPDSKERPRAGIMILVFGPATG